MCGRARGLGRQTGGGGKPFVRSLPTTQGLPDGEARPQSRESRLGGVGGGEPPGHSDMGKSWRRPHSRLFGLPQAAKAQGAP